METETLRRAAFWFLNDPVKRIVQIVSLLAVTALVFGATTALAGSPKHHCASIGPANGGALKWGKQLRGSPRIEVREGLNWGTPELVNAIERATDVVHAKHGTAYRIYVGDLSRRRGGKLKRHKSHQTGRDADIGYWLKQKHSPGYFRKATSKTLDVPRTWTFIQALIEHGAQLIFIDYRLQAPLYRYARKQGFKKHQLEPIFQYPHGRKKRQGIVRHVRGHADHIHVRVRASQSVAHGKAYLRKHPNAIAAQPVRYKVRRGDNLTRIARKFKVTIKKLRRWNKMPRKSKKRNRLRRGQTLIVGYKRPKLPV